MRHCIYLARRVMRYVTACLFSCVFALNLLLGVSGIAHAKEAANLAADPVAEARLQALSAELRCLVCQNQTIADSNAELAQDLRREVRNMIQAGQSDQQILDFLVARYGDFVLYRPPVKGLTLVLWGGPLLLLLVGVIALGRYLRQREKTLVANEQPLSAEEQQRANALLHAEEPRS